MESAALQQANFIVQILVGIAAVISLLYVAAQLRQNTRAIRSSTLFDITDQLKDIYTLHSSTDSMSRCFVNGSRGDELNDIDAFRFYAALHALFRAYENIYYQKNAGTLDSRFWMGAIKTLIDLTDLPGFKKYWNDRRHWYSDDFQNHIDNDVIAIPGNPKFGWAHNTQAVHQ